MNLQACIAVNSACCRWYSRGAIPRDRLHAAENAVGRSRPCRVSGPATWAIPMQRPAALGARSHSHRRGIREETGTGAAPGKGRRRIHRHERHQTRHIGPLSYWTERSGRTHAPDFAHRRSAGRKTPRPDSPEAEHYRKEAKLPGEWRGKADSRRTSTSTTTASRAVCWAR